jgi:hypothetical protein
MKRSVIASVVVLAACGHSHSHDGVDGGGVDDSSVADAAGDSGNHGGGDGGGLDGGAHDGGLDDGGAHDGGSLDGGQGTGDGGALDGGAFDAGSPDAPTGIISGGPCISGAAGATAYRVRWANGGGTAYPVYEVNGLPDHSQDHTGAYGYQFGFQAAFVDPYLGDGGLQLDGSDFVDIEISTAGISSISEATLSIYGRSYNTTASGSFNWQTLEGYGEAPINFVSNVAPYQWYSADMTTEISPGSSNFLLRIKSGPNSDSLVVNRIELCLVAQ